MEALRPFLIDDRVHVNVKGKTTTLLSLGQARGAIRKSFVLYHISRLVHPAEVDIHIPNDNGERAHDVARDRTNDDVVRLLEECVELERSLEERHREEEDQRRRKERNRCSIRNSKLIF